MSDDTGRLVERRRDGRVLVISMQRAEKRNAVDRALADALDAALNELDDDDDIWAGVLTGTADVFSAGSDLTAGGDYVTSRGGEYGIMRRHRRKPLVAAVEGPALGGGLEIVLACDLVVAASAARFGLPEVRIGVVPTCAGLFRAPRALPLNVARQLILTGRPIDAHRAYEVGFGQRPHRTGTGTRRGHSSRPGDLHQRPRVRAVLPRCRQHLDRCGRRARLAADPRGPRGGIPVRGRTRRDRRLPREASTRLDGTLTPLFS